MLVLVPAQTMQGAANSTRMTNGAALRHHEALCDIERGGRLFSTSTVVWIGDFNASRFTEPVVPAANSADHHVTMAALHACLFADASGSFLHGRAGRGSRGLVAGGERRGVCGRLAAGRGASAHFWTWGFRRGENRVMSSAVPRFRSGPKDVTVTPVSLQVMTYGCSHASTLRALASRNLPSTSCLTDGQSESPWRICHW